jgi:4-amino-4-deoxy-L-arabinose transferase-like glycosyltransferase
MSEAPLPDVPRSLGAPPAASDPGAAPAIPSKAALDRKDWVILAALLAIFALTRGGVFPYAENLYGDSVARSEIAQRWADDPHLLTSVKNDVFQFGPLHFYAMGTALKIWPSREHATRLVSLLLALAMVFPAYRLGKRLFSRRAAVAALLAIAAWGLHIQASTTAASEALFMTLFFFALDFFFQGLQEERFTPLAISALFVNLFCATRYDGWMYIPLLGLVAALDGKDRIASATRAVLFLLLCLPFPLWWMERSEKETGDALWAVHYIESFHSQWVQGGVAWLGRLGQRLMALFFWPGSLLVSCSLGVGLFAIAGLVKAFRSRQRRALAVLALVPALYFTVRSAGLLDFYPIARFAMVQVALSLFYVKDGFDWLCGRWPLGLRRGTAALTAAIAVGTTVWLGATTAWSSGKIPDTLRPISPLSTVPTDQMAAARFLKQHVSGNESLLVDEISDYLDVNVSFFTSLPEERLVRRRWPDFEERLLHHSDLAWLFSAQGGRLQIEEGIRTGEQTLLWRGRTYDLAFSPPPASSQAAKLFVYRQRGTNH